MLKAILTLAQSLIACRSITPHDADCQKTIGYRLEKAGFTVESMRFGNVDNLWARVGNQSPLILFAGHTDVVPPGELSTWTYPPFTPEIKEGYLYGRGATDMKGALAAMVIAAETFIKKHPDFKGSLGFLITSDEEGDGIDGTQRVIDILGKRGDKIDYCIIGEASSEKRVGDQIRIGRRGSLHGKLIVHGKQGHVAYPDRIINPIHQSLAALDALAKTEWDKGNEFFPPTSFQLTNIMSGTGAANVVPGQLEALFNLRFSTALTIDAIKERTEAILHQHGLHFDLRWQIGGEPFITKKGKLVTATQRAIKEITGLDSVSSTGGGTSDGRYIAPTGAEVVELGVLNATAHQIDERVRVEDLDTLARIYEKLLKILLDVAA